MTSRRAFLVAASAALAGRKAWGAPQFSPIVQNLQPTTASFVFLTPESLEMLVEWRALPDGATWRAATMDRTWLIPPEQRASSPLAKVTARLDRLPPGTTVECRLLLGGSEWGARWPLRVPAEHSLSGDVLVIGDSGHAGAEQQAVLQQMLAVENPELLIHTGDLAYPVASVDSLRQHYFEPYAPLMRSVPFYPAIGNHDTPDDQGAALIAMHDLPAAPSVPEDHSGRYYSFTRGPVQFLVLDSNEPLLEESDAGNRMLSWLRGELARSKSFWRVAVFHHTPYPAGLHANDRMCTLARERILPILESFQAPLVLCGHEHVYKRTAAPPEGQGGTMYVTTGGGGGSLYPAVLSEPNVIARSIHHFVRLRFEGARMTLRAVDLNGETIDEAVLAPPPTVRNLAWEPGTSIHVEGSHLALPGEEHSIEVLLNNQPVDAVSITGTSVELPFSEYAPPSGELRIRTPNGERLIVIQPDQI